MWWRIRDDRHVPRGAASYDSTLAGGPTCCYAGVPMDELANPTMGDWHARMLAFRERLAAALPDIDPGDLLLILECVVRGPAGGRAFFIREVRPGVYAP